MTQNHNASTSLWLVLIPLAAWLTLALVWGRVRNWMLISFIIATLLATVMVAVHHAEVIALRVGEPFGTLVLALAVTVIEVALVVALMLSGGEAASTLARDTVFATVMIICNGVIGLCLLLGALRHHALEFRVEGTTPALSVLATLTTLTLVLPSLTSTTPGPTLSTAQLAFAGTVSLILYGVFIFVQTVRHRDYFLVLEDDNDDTHLAAPSLTSAWTSFGLPAMALVALVGLAKILAPSIEKAVYQAGVPHDGSTSVGISVALMVLLPETWARCVRRSAIACRPVSISHSDRPSPPLVCRYRRWW